MKIDGKKLADEILQKEIRAIKRATIGSDPKIAPTLAVILVGDNPASLSYIKQKQKAADSIGVNLILKKFPNDISQISLISQINQINDNPKIHGIIVQRPLPPQINPAIIAQSIARDKDIDGFRKNSPFTPPIAIAVIKILYFCFSKIKEKNLNRLEHSNLKNWNLFQISNFKFQIFIDWLKTRNIIILGRGETGGKPIADTFKKMNIKFTVVHSKTKNTNELLKKSDIIISCIGKPEFIKGDMIKKGTICIGVGVSRQNKKILGDLEEESISNIASFYTPTPGGVGPVNVACLMENLITAWKKCYNFTSNGKTQI